MDAPDSDEEQQALGGATSGTSLGRTDTSQPIQHNPAASTYGRSDLMEPVPPWTTINRT